ncbi:hypothetical protein Q4E40_02815 [Pontibacter sp. BT731]|uniref:hypothetical protein n=1 Tax=Pontibacter coccineus TaxID=3063328 RepID=UPI0026E3FB9C|nr:hypothetical protein [Pontibacter sp. BT731]MDO6389045.1 hypothetical protein [Pontibacter sp. BT731]
MKNSLRRFYAKHCASLAQTLYTNRLLIARLSIGLGLYNIIGVLLIWVNLHAEFTALLPAMSSLESVFRFFTGCLLIGGGWHFAEKFSLEIWQDKREEKLLARAARRKERHLQAVGKINLN